MIISDSNVDVEEGENLPVLETPLVMLDSSSEPPLRKVGMYGDISEERCAEIVYSLLALADPSRYGEGEEILPLEVVVSSQGGAAHEMFAVYDTIRVLKTQCEIGTLGLGKVMSAAVLLLASGTKGKRRIGKYCRVMLHSVASGHVGELFNLENELEEAQHTQKQYIRALAEETKMSQKQIRDILGKKVNVYFTAEVAVDLGIADEVV